MTMCVALQMVLAVEGMFMSSLPPGQLVTSRADCVSRCHFDPGCLSVFYDTSTRQCVQVNATYCQADMDTSAAFMQYLHPQKGCKDGYSRNEALHLCYKVYGEDTWYMARDRCSLDGGHLVSVTNPTINQFMYQLCLSEGVELWTAGNDIDVEGTWIWADNSSFTYTNWEHREPSNYSVENCMRLNCIGVEEGQWRDTSCGDATAHTYKFVCQTSVIDIPLC